MLEKIVFQEFEDVVGKGNIDDSEVITETYAYNWCVEVVSVMEGKEPTQYSPRPKAVIMPSTTEEVSEIVKLCNKHDIQFKAQSTGLGPWNQPSTDNCIIVDLRRMNRIVKIDEKNMYAVVEPYVSGAQLQVELMKQGLNCHMPGAGPQVSPLASATSMNGPGFTSPSTGYSSRNVLGVEWVLPDGQIIKLGSLGLKNSPDWYSGDGPGFSLRGIMRGFAGAKSGNGIFTRVAVKVFPYPCETRWEIKGSSPDYEFEVPDFLNMYLLEGETYQKAEEIELSIEEEGISFLCSLLSGFGATAIFSNSIESLLSKALLAAIKVPIFVIINGRTRREFEFKKKLMQHIMDNHGVINILEEKFKAPSITYAEALRSNLGLHGFIATGVFQSAHGAVETLNMCLNSVKKNIPLKKKWIKKGQIANDFGEAVWSSSYEHGHMFHAEMITLYDQTSDYSVRGMAEYCDAANQMDLVKHLGIPFFIEGNRRHDWYGPHVMNYNKWLRKIKVMLDPNNIADSGFYISSTKEGGKSSE
ncbi:MAG: FAD-binding oxidoreductase [Candidatus Hodarchaeota archaeon]